MTLAPAQPRSLSLPITPNTVRDRSRATPRLSVVIVNYCQWDNTTALVSRILASGPARRGTVEVQVLDNHSPEHPAAERLERWPGVGLQRWGRNRGFARAVNAGCRQSRAPWFLLLNPDIEVSEEFLEGVAALAERLEEEEPRTGIVGFRLRNSDGSPQLSSGRFPTLLGTLAGLFRPRSRRKYSPPPAGARHPVPWATGCCLLLRGECWEDLGGLDESFFLYYEDVDLCRRAWERGWTVCYEPALAVVHHHPLHQRAVPPHLRLVTRHALLTYAARYWPRWQTYLLAGIIRGEAWLRRLWARGRGDGEAARCFGDLDALAADLARGYPVAARRRLLRVVRRTEQSFLSPPEAPARDALAGASGGERNEFPPRRSKLPPPLSLVIPGHNRADLLPACLASVFRNGPEGMQVIVVDDASPGGAVSAVARRFPGVEVIRLPRRGGFCVAANAGIRSCRAPIVELLNDDAEATAGWAAAALAVFRDPNIAAVAPLVLAWPDGQRVDSAGDRYYLGGIAGKRGHGEPLGPAHLRPGRVFGASASSAFYRREALERVGGFPERFGAYFEDVDLAFRLHRAGYRVHFEPASRVLHRISASHGQPHGRLLEQQSRNEERVFWRNLPAGALVRALPRHVAVLAAKAWRRWQEGTLRPFLCGRLRALADLPDLVRHRRGLRRLGPARSLEEMEVELRFWGSSSAT